MISKSNHFLLQPEAREVLKQKLVPRAFVITPNIPEAQLIAGVEIHDEEGMRKAAKIIRTMGARNVSREGRSSRRHGRRHPLRRERLLPV